MADTASRLAPKRSLRPLTRPAVASTDADEVKEEEGLAQLAERRRQRAENRDRELRALGNLELRADMDRYLAGDPLARLGFDPERVDWFSPYGGLDPFNTAQGGDLGSGLSSESRRRYDAMYPDRAGMVPEDTVMMTANWPLSVLAHESRHRGIDELTRAGRDVDPMRQLYEEAVVEVGDQPFLDETINLPRETQAFERGERVSPPLSATIDVPNPPEGVLRYEKVLQELAQDELTRRGEPPRAQRREPEPELSGVQRLLRSIFGGD